jgi:hypothetical protein
MKRLYAIFLASLCAIASLSTLHAAVSADAVSPDGVLHSLQTQPAPVAEYAEEPEVFLVLTADGELYLVAKKPCLENFSVPQDMHRQNPAASSLEYAWENDYHAILLGCHIRRRLTTLRMALSTAPDPIG